MFPSLSATAIPHDREIRFRRGDSLDIPVQIQDDGDPPEYEPIGGGVLRWAAKIGYGVTEREGVVVGNDGALILKRSYDPKEIEFTQSASGRAIIHVRRADTMNLPLVPAVWDLELTKSASVIDVPSGATVQLVKGSPSVLANGLDFRAMEVMPGDLFAAQGYTVLVTKVTSPIHMEVDFTDWETGSVPASAPGSAPEFCMFVGKVKTVASGPFVVEGDVIL